MEMNKRDEEIFEIASCSAKDKAREISSLCRRPVPDDLVDMFIAGAEWADAHPKNPWISVKEQLPPVDDNTISEQSDPVLVKVAEHGHYEPEILVYNKHYHVWDTADADDFHCHVSDGDLWMPIPEQNKD